MASFLLNKLTPGCVAGEENGILGPSEDTGFVGTELSLNYASVSAIPLVSWHGLSLTSIVARRPTRSISVHETPSPPPGQRTSFVIRTVFPYPSRTKNKSRRRCDLYLTCSADRPVRVRTTHLCMLFSTNGTLRYAVQEHKRKHVPWRRHVPASSIDRLTTKACMISSGWYDRLSRSTSHGQQVRPARDDKRLGPNQPRAPAVYPTHHRSSSGSET
jgi:hypothetical protein